MSPSRPRRALDAALAASDIVLLGTDLAPLADAVRMSRVAVARMRQNFAISVAYNVIAVPIALLGFATPLISAIAMSLSSITVSPNALRTQAMDVLIWLIPTSLVLGLVGLGAFVWTLRHRQCDDPSGDAARICCRIGTNTPSHSVGRRPAANFVQDWLNGPLRTFKADRSSRCNIPFAVAGNQTSPQRGAPKPAIPSCHGRGKSSVAWARSGLAFEHKRAPS